MLAGLLRVSLCSVVLGGAKCNGRHAELVNKINALFSRCQLRITFPAFAFLLESRDYTHPLDHYFSSCLILRLRAKMPCNYIDKW
jgi:hypothetical protein